MAQTPKEVVAYWLSEIKASRKRHERYRKMGKEVFDLYEADQEQETPFNILYSNTETLRPALFSAQPRPIVERRFKDDDPIGKLAAQASTRVLEYHLDTNRQGYETLNEAMGACVLDAILPGRGMVTVKFDADFYTIPEPRPPDDEGKESAKEDPRGESSEYAENEQVCFESVIWDRVHLGYAKKWHKLPWLAYEFFLTKAEAESLFGKGTADKLKYLSTQDTEGAREKTTEENESMGVQKTARVYQIWDKAGGRKVLYISDTYPDAILKEQDDPLGLSGFYNTPRPLMFVEKTCTLTPTAPYKMYKSQADELNRITRRIKRITEAIKARGLYDGALGGDIEKMMTKDDNALVPAEVSSSLATEKGFSNAIWFLPLDILIAVLQQLFQAREACKQTIYEITGISDIIRGSTSASETATAQTIKNQWGTLRLKRMQSEVARYVRDLERMVLDIATAKFSEETWAAMTGLPFVTTAQRQQLEQQAQVMTQMQIPGQPPDPQFQAIQQELAKPVWGQILQLLKDDLARSYRVDIETNSTVEPEAAEDQKAITELMGAIGQTLNGLGPLVAQGVLPFQAAQSLLLFIARRFRFGGQIEEYIQAMQAPKPPDDGGEAKAKQMQQQMDMDKQMAVKEIEHKKKESEMSLKEQSMMMEMEQKQREMDLQLREMQLQLKEHQFGMEQKAGQALMGMERQRVDEELSTKKQLHEMKEKKFNTEAVVNKKTDTALNSVNQAVQKVQQLGESLQTIQQQAQETQQLLSALLKATTAKRVKKPIRGKDGRIESVEEVMA